MLLHMDGSFTFPLMLHKHKRICFWLTHSSTIPTEGLGDAGGRCGSGGGFRWWYSGSIRGAGGVRGMIMVCHVDWKRSREEYSKLTFSRASTSRCC